jgi:quaternary ammonium compound-resistance protein SugE
MRAAAPISRGADASCGADALRCEREATPSPKWAKGRDGPDLGCSKEDARMAWLLLFVAGVFEVVWAYYMKQSSGFTRLWPTVITVATMIASFLLLSFAMRTLPLGTAYAVWTGIGAVGAFVVGIVVLGEPANAARILAALLIVSGLVLMRTSSAP